jgi:hypothetical protein
MKKSTAIIDALFNDYEGLLKEITDSNSETSSERLMSLSTQIDELQSRSADVLESLVNEIAQVRPHPVTPAPIISSPEDASIAALSDLESLIDVYPTLERFCDHFDLISALMSLLKRCPEHKSEISEILQRRQQIEE